MSQPTQCLTRSVQYHKLPYDFGSVKITFQLFNNCKFTSVDVQIVINWNVSPSLHSSPESKIKNLPVHTSVYGQVLHNTMPVEQGQFIIKSPHK